MKVLVVLGIILMTLNLILALSIKPPSPKRKSNNSENYASEASRIVAINLLKSYNDIDSNQVHSPLGVTTVLAILAEAAQGSTYQEFCNVLQYPANSSYLRHSFKKLLNNYQTRAYGYEPSFQTWLYVYRNFTINDNFKQLLHDYYYVAIKDINYNDYDWNTPSTLLDVESITLTPNSTSTTNSKDVVGFETLKRFKIYDEERASDVDCQPKYNDDTNKNNTKSNFSSEEITFTTDTYGNEYFDKEPSKFDRIVDDKQSNAKTVQISKIEEIGLGQKQDFLSKYVNKTENNLEEQKRQIHDIHNYKSGENGSEKLVTVDTTVRSIDQSFNGRIFNLEENETMQEEEIISNREQSTKMKIAKKFNFKKPMKRNTPPNEPEKVSLPLEKLAAALHDSTTKSAICDDILALKERINSSRNSFSGRKSFRKDDITSALSANSITGRENNSKTKILLFNGLYFRGTWAIPFLVEQQNELFYMTKEDNIKVIMMHAKGKFQSANLPHLNAKILCLPYENQKYKLLIVLPNELEGLHDLIVAMQTNDLQVARESMIEQDLHVKLPKFQFEETSRSESMLKGLGLTRIFSRQEADLSLLSKDQAVHVEDVVQFVSIRVDDAGTNEAALSALDTHSRNTEKEFKLFEVNHPFIFMIIDSENDFILVSGKVHTPELLYEIPDIIEVDITVS